MHRFRLLKGRLTPSLVISMISLFVALSSVAYAAEVVPLAVRALTANKANTAKTANTAKVANLAKLANVAKTARKANTAKVANVAKTANTARTADTASTAETANTAVDSQTLGGQTAAQIAATPGPASSLPAGLLTLRSKGWSVQNEGDKTLERALCQTGEKAVGGGWDMPNGAADTIADGPLADLSGWQFRVWALSGNNTPASGSVWVICAKVS